MRKLSFFVLLTLLAGILSSCGTSPTAVPTVSLPSYTLNYAEMNQEGHPTATTGAYFADRVKELSNGRIVINVTFGADSSTDEGMVAMTAEGTIDIFRTGAMGVDQSLQISALALPYIFKDSEHSWRVMRSEFGKRMLDEISSSDVGYLGLAYVYEGPRHFLTVNKVTSAEDMEGLVIRGKAGIVDEFVEALGATVKDVAFSELHGALKRGEIDGAEQPIIGYRGQKLYEVAPYIILDHHTYNPGIIIVSQKSWDKLDTEAQEIIRQAAIEAEDFSKTTAMSLEESTLNQLKDMGVTITEVDDITPWQEKTRDIREKYSENFPDFLREVSLIG